MTKPCEAFLPALVDAAEGEGTPALSGELSAHLPGCAGCYDALVALKEDLLAIAPPPAAEPGPFLAASVRRAHEAKRRPTARFWRRLRFVLPVLLPATATALFVLFTPMKPETDGSTEAGREAAAFFDELAASTDEGGEEVINAVLAETTFDLFDDDAIDEALGDAELELDLILDTFPG